MNAIASADSATRLADLDIPPAPPERPVEWLRAVRALRDLLNDPEQTEKALEIFLALDGAHNEAFFQRMLADPQGHRLLVERPCLLGRLSDRDGLARLPAGSFGRAYLAYLERTGLDPGGLVQLKADMELHAESIGEALPVCDPIREWFRVRGILTHDLWHVLTGYGTDALGETALLAFSYAQVPTRANRLLAIGAGVRSTIDLGVGFTRYLYHAWRRGRHATWLPALRYEDLLDQPLAAVQLAARIAPASVAHPSTGILCGSTSKPGGDPSRAAA
jgi:ubiquinone biosynthesis protein COQ4